MLSECRSGDPDIVTNYRTRSEELDLVGELPYFFLQFLKAYQTTNYTTQSLLAEAGAYFALVQFLSWVVSGLACAR
jgi:hypothetical protein